MSQRPRPSPVPPRPAAREEFTPLEREALDLWRTVEGPADAGAEARPPGRADFAARVVAAAGVGAPKRAGVWMAGAGRSMAVAALALVLVGGVFSMRALFGRAPGGPVFGPAPLYDRSAGGGLDAGPRPEVRAPVDGEGDDHAGRLELQEEEEEEEDRGARPS